MSNTYITCSCGHRASWNLTNCGGDEVEVYTKIIKHHNCRECGGLSSFTDLTNTVLKIGKAIHEYNRKMKVCTEIEDGKIHFSYEDGEGCAELRDLITKAGFWDEIEKRFAYMASNVISNYIKNATSDAVKN